MFGWFEERKTGASKNDRTGIEPSVREVSELLFYAQQNKISLSEKHLNTLLAFVASKTEVSFDLTRNTDEGSSGNDANENYKADVGIQKTNSPSEETPGGSKGDSNNECDESKVDESNPDEIVDRSLQKERQMVNLPGNKEEGQKQ